MVFTADEERQIRKMLELHLQRMKVHALSAKMEGKHIADPSIAAVRQQHTIESAKCRTIIEQIIAEEGL